MTQIPQGIHTTQAAQPIGPYQQAVHCNNLVFTSGQIALDSTSGEMMQNSIEQETQQALDNLHQVLLAAGSDWPQVIKTTIYVTDLSLFDAINAVYSSCFQCNPPARSCVEVSALPKGARIEIEAIAQCLPQ